MVRGPGLPSFCITAWLPNKRVVLKRPRGLLTASGQWFNWGRLKCPPQEGLPFKDQAGRAPLAVSTGPALASPLPSHRPRKSVDRTLWPACLGVPSDPWTISTICSHSLVLWLSLAQAGWKAELDTNRIGSLKALAAPHTHPDWPLPPPCAPVPGLLPRAPACLELHGHQWSPSLATH